LALSARRKGKRRKRKEKEKEKKGKAIDALKKIKMKTWPYS